MLSGIRGVRLAVLRVDAKFKYDDVTPSSTASASSAVSSSAATGSTPGPRPSSGDAWPRSATGRPARTDHHLARCGATVGLADRGDTVGPTGSAPPVHLIPAGTGWLGLKHGALIFLAPGPAQLRPFAGAELWTDPDMT